MPKKNIVLGIFDSGIGGLTVAREIERSIPGVSYVYFGDTARLPYGTKTPGTVVNYALQNSKFLKRHGATVPVIACNTASAAILKIKNADKKVSRIFIKTPVFNVIEPAVEAAKAVTRTKRIGVLATPTTVHSKIYERLLKGYIVVSVAAPLLVPLIEAGWEKKAETRSILREYLAPLKKKRVDTVILGCTHYPFIAPLVRDMMGKNVRIVNPAEKTAHYIKRFLGSSVGKKRNRKFFVSDMPEGFVAQAEKFMGRKIHARLASIS